MNSKKKVREVKTRIEVRKNSGARTTLQRSRPFSRCTLVQNTVALLDVNVTTKKFRHEIKKHGHAPKIQSLSDSAMCRLRLS